MLLIFIINVTIIKLLCKFNVQNFYNRIMFDLFIICDVNSGICTCFIKAKSFPLSATTTRQK